MRGTLKTPLAHPPVGAATIILAVASLVSGAVGWSGRLFPTALAGGLFAGGIGLLLHALKDLSKAERLARGLASAPRGSRQSLLAALTGASAQMVAVRHRLSAAHPISGAPLREHLLGAMRRSLSAAPERGVLGVVRLADFDLIARFDLTRAQASLRQFAAGLAGAAGPKRPLGQIDRDCFGVWFEEIEDPQEAQGALDALVRQAVACVAAADLIATARAESAVMPVRGAHGAEGEVIAAALGRLAQTPRRSAAAQASEPRHEDVRDAFNLEQAVVSAMAQGRLETVFQPVVSMPSGQVVGAEALLRWQHPGLGPIPPERFVPMLEARGLGETLGRYVLAAACAEASAWRACGLGALTVAVNLGPQQILDPDLPTYLKTLLRERRLEGPAVELELTETVAMADPTATRSAFLALRAVGVTLSADDFGKGYSSISYLKNLPFNKLKIDREFVAGLDHRPDSRAICRVMITLGRDLGLSVLAEGVETRAEFEALRALGCALFQGYYFSGPLEGEAFRRFAAMGTKGRDGGLLGGSRPGSDSGP